MNKYLVQYIITFKGEDYSDCEYPEFEIEANSIKEAKELAFKKHYNEVNDIASDYGEEYYDSDFEILEISEIKQNS
jgi:hypothetical protein